MDAEDGTLDTVQKTHSLGDIYIPDIEKGMAVVHAVRLEQALVDEPSENGLRDSIPSSRPMDNESLAVEINPANEFQYV